MTNFEKILTDIVSDNTDFENLKLGIICTVSECPSCPMREMCYSDAYDDADMVDWLEQEIDE